MSITCEHHYRQTQRRMRYRWLAPLGSTAIVGLTTIPAFAQISPQPTDTTAASSTDNASNAAILVTGRGSSRQVQTLTAAAIAQTVPGTTPLKALGALPAVSFVSSDALGTDPYSQSIYIRGFASDQLGFTLDGVPLGSQTYFAFTGLNINYAIGQQNIGRVNVSQGAGAVDVPSSNNLGGVIQFQSSDPKAGFGATISQTFGSYSTFSTNVRVDSGVLNGTGTKFYVSYNRSDENKYKGSGSQFMQQVNAKLIQPVFGTGQLSLFFDWSDVSAATYADLSLDAIKKIGTKLDYLKPDYAAAYDIGLLVRGLPGGALPAGYAALNDPIDASYYDGPAIAHNYFGYAKLEVEPFDHARWTTTAYGQGKSFYAWWVNPFVNSPNGAPLAAQNRGVNSQRFGVTSDFKYSFGKHEIDAGVWYEYSHEDPFLSYYQEPLLGQGSPVDATKHIPTPFATAWKYAYRNDTVQTYLQDTYKPFSDFTINAGFRSLFFTGKTSILLNNQTYTGVPTIPSGSISNNAAFLPQFSANYRLGGKHELFFDFAKNMRVFPELGFNSASPWGVTTQAAFDDAKANLKPETAYIYELGYRYASSKLTALLALYHTDFHNRLATISTGSIVNIASILANVGNVDMNGVDASVTALPVTNVSFTNSVSYNSSKYQNDVTSAGVTYDLKGAQEVNYPKFMYKTNLSYDTSGVFGHIDAMYMSKRFISYTDDTHVPGYWIANLGLGYHLGDHGPAHNATVSFNVYNLFNKDYIANMGEQGNPFSGDAQTLMSGAPRTFYGTVSVDF